MHGRRRLGACFARLAGAHGWRGCSAGSGSGSDAQEALERGYRARNRGSEFSGVHVLGDVGQDLDDVLEEAARALVAVVFACDAEEEGRAEGAVDGGPRACCKGGHVLQAEEGFDGVGQAVDASFAQGFGEIEACGCGADGGPAQLRGDVGDVQVEGPVLELVAHGAAAARVFEVVCGVEHDFLERVAVLGDADEGVVGVLLALPLAHDVEADFAEAVHALDVGAGAGGRVLAERDGMVDGGGGGGAVVGHGEERILPEECPPHFAAYDALLHGC